MPENSTQIPAEAANFDVVVVDQSRDARDAARLNAEARMTDELNTGGRMRRFVKNIWKGNIAREYYTLQYQREAQREIENAQDVLVGETNDATARARAQLATIERFQSEYDEAIHESAGETRQELAPDSEFARETKSLIRKFVTGEISNEAALREERSRLLEAFSETASPDLVGEGKVRIDNIVSVACAVKGAVEHGQSLDDVMEGMQIRSGEARTNVRTEVNYSKTDKIIEKLQSSRVGSLIGPETIATAATIAASVLRVGSKKVVGAAAMTVAPGVAAGFWAGLRENKRTKDERTQHAREMAQGKTFMVDSRRRAEVEQARYETVRATDLTNELNQYFNSENALESNDAVQAALDALAAVQARMAISDQDKIDLIAYSDAALVDEERFALDIARANAKVVMRHRLDADTRLALGLDADQDIDDILTNRTEVFEQLEQDISAKDEAFRKLKRRRVAKATVVGVGVGLIAGATFQEGLAAIEPTREGLVEQLWQHQTTEYHGMVHQTLLEGIAHGGGSAEHIPTSTEYLSHNLGHGNSLDISSDHSFIHNADGTYTIRAGNGSDLMADIHMNSNGTFSQATLDDMRNHGIVVTDTPTTISHTEYITQSVSVDKFIGDHSAQTTHITRDYWFDNNTPTKFDHNELNLWWGGDSGSGVSHDGAVSMSVARMTANGSFHADHSTNWLTDAKGGHLKLAISASKDTQDHVFMVDINKDGSINIPKGSPAAQLFSVENGHQVFRGAYAEVVDSGPKVNGIDHVRPLATLVGKNDVHSVTESIPKTVNVVHHTYELTTPGYEEHTERFTEMAPVIPIAPRRPLESLAKRRRSIYNGYNNEYGEYAVNDAEAEHLRQEFSPRIQENPDAKLNLREEADWYLERERARRPADIERLEREIDSSEELASAPEGIETIITIPLRAKSDGENIYQTLSQLAKQPRSAVEKSIILINVNHLDADNNDPATVQKIESAWREIERAKNDFGQLKVVAIDSEYNETYVKSTGGAIGHVVRDMNDAALLAIRRLENEGKIKGEDDVVLWRSDADVNGRYRKSLLNIQQAAQNYSETDIFRGTTKFGTTRATQYPGFAFALDIYNIAQASRAARGEVHTGGANFGVKASTYAAVGGLGDMADGSGEGTDDVAIGKRIVAARNRKVNNRRSMSYLTGVPTARRASGTPLDPDRRYGQAARYMPTAANREPRRVIRHIIAGIDTNADRQLPLYLNNEYWGDAWNPGKFTDNRGKYVERDALLNGALQKIPRDDFGGTGRTGKSFEFIETNISRELNYVAESPEILKRVLSTKFFLMPGAYTLRELRTNDDKTMIEFKFTRAGRHILRQQMERFGNKKIAGLYSKTPLNKRPAFIR